MEGKFMKIVAINGSPRKNGNTAQVLEVVRREVEAAGVEFQVFQPGAKVHPCMACYHCLNTGSLRCVQTDDMVNDIIAACIEADGILLAAPVYHGGISGNMKCVLDRLMLAAGCGVNQLHHKVGANVKNGITFNSKVYIVGEYLQSRGKKDFNLIGYDLLERNVTCLKEGSVSFLIAQQPELQGLNGIKALCDHLIFKKDVTCINYMPIDLLTVETIDYYHSK